MDAAKRTRIITNGPSWLWNMIEREMNLSGNANWSDTITASVWLRSKKFRTLQDAINEFAGLDFDARLAWYAAAHYDSGSYLLCPSQLFEVGLPGEAFSLLEHMMFDLAGSDFSLKLTYPLDEWGNRGEWYE